VTKEFKKQEQTLQSTASTIRYPLLS